ncbi:hypothetical protein AAG906_014294 [Vitis piasezkii]
MVELVSIWENYGIGAMGKVESCDLEQASRQCRNGRIGVGLEKLRNRAVLGRSGIRSGDLEKWNACVSENCLATAEMVESGRLGKLWNQGDREKVKCCDAGKAVLAVEMIESVSLREKLWNWASWAKVESCLILGKRLTNAEMVESVSVPENYGIRAMQEKWNGLIWGITATSEMEMECGSAGRLWNGALSGKVD